MLVVPTALEAILAEIRSASVPEAAAYLAGAARDGTINAAHRTLRISQADIRWIQILKLLLEKLGKRGWIYEEGNRGVFVVETTWRGTQIDLDWNASEKAALTRGYFDAEGGIPRQTSARMYIQMVQKNRDELDLVRVFCGDLGLECGRIHNPSVALDPDYWRFYVRASAHQAFARTIGSWHPRKRDLLEQRGLIPYVESTGPDS